MTRTVVSFGDIWGWVTVHDDGSVLLRSDRPDEPPIAVRLSIEIERLNIALARTEEAADLAHGKDQMQLAMELQHCRAMSAKAVPVIEDPGPREPPEWK